jgi:hypothetical protein
VLYSVKDLADQEREQGKEQGAGSEEHVQRIAWCVVRGGRGMGGMGAMAIMRGAGLGDLGFHGGGD